MGINKKFENINSYMVNFLKDKKYDTSIFPKNIVNIDNIKKE